MNSKENPYKDLKLYSLKAISVATFFGGPIAAGYLVRQNYLAINEVEKAKKSFIIGLISTVLLFTLLFILPEEIINRIPRILIPGFYTLLIHFIVNKLQSDLLKKHEERKNQFYTKWRATGIGFLFSLLIIIGIFVTSYILVPKEYRIYDTKMETFYINDEETNNILTTIDNLNMTEAVDKINNIIAPKWKINVDILKRINQIENLPKELLEENKLFMEYSNLKIESFEVMKMSIMFDNEKYYNKLQNIYKKTDSIINLININ